jgi:hypothetical protein
VTTADSECVHLSLVYRGSTHNKTTFDDSQVVRFLTTSIDNNPWRNVVLADLGYVGIRRTVSEAIRPHKGFSYQDYSPEQAELNRILGRNRILMENVLVGGRCYPKSCTASLKEPSHY